MFYLPVLSITTNRTVKCIGCVCVCVLYIQTVKWSVCRYNSVVIFLVDVGEIYSRLLDHRPVIQGEIRYFIKEFEEKRGLRELRVLENLNNTIFEANDKILPKCEEVMHGNLNEILKRLQVANQMFHTLQQTEQEESQLQTEKLRAAEAQCIADWEEFMKEQHRLKTMVNEEHAKATEHLKEQYAALEKDLPKQAL
uniref:Biogenesis of lysosome-related organelles complex 1 subunit 5 n=1 Tax=Pseudonaja textilis TaxID=8673 RepID=A0A670ZGA3_PSETE